MGREKRMLVNTALLTGTSLCMRAIGMVFQVYLSNRLGPAGIGLFQLVMSVSTLAATIAISGVRFAATRLLSEELGKGNPGGLRPAVLRCCLYAGTFGAAVCVGLTAAAGFIGRRIIGEPDTILSLRLLAVSLPFLSLGSVFAGYFTAVSRVGKSAGVALAEQVIRIGVILLALRLIPAQNLEYACAAVVFGNVTGECCSFLLLAVLYRFDVRRYRRRDAETGGMTRRMLAIALPLAFSSYARTALSTLQNLLVPKGLERSGASAKQALAGYGMIGGMVFPVITFPSALFYALAELMVPELTAMQVSGRQEQIAHTVNRILRSCLLFALGVSVCLFCFSHRLGMALYHSREVGRYIRILSFLMPVMYLDSITDGLLRGLGQQMYCMYVNIADSVLSVLLVWFALPRWGIGGYLFMICFTEVFNFSLSLYKLRRLTTVRMPPTLLFRALLCAAGSGAGAALFLGPVGIGADAVFPLILSLSVCLGLYWVLLRITGCLGTGRKISLRPRAGNDTI
ncbi:MAG: oligosaccharide flippase family protein [Oscillospiraceae bacterium]|nr:oligosaccharide flippase family protein [Oscillospiraceae bacterium]